MNDAPTSRAQQRQDTQDRILAAARRLFAESGYDRTTIRAVASAANVDPGLVMHYYRSKERLFAEATQGRRVPLPGGTADEVAGQLLDMVHQSLAEVPTHSLAVLRSMLTHSESAHEIQEGAREYQHRISESIPDDDADLRAALLSATMIGVVLGRHLIKFDHLATADPQRVVEILAPCIRSLAKADG